MAMTPTIWATLPVEVHSPMAVLWADLLCRHLSSRRAPEGQTHHEQPFQGGATPHPSTRRHLHPAVDAAVCQSFLAREIDRTVAEAFLEAVRPAGLEATIAALLGAGLLPPVPASCAGYALVAALNYWLRRRLVFRSRRPHRAPELDLRWLGTDSNTMLPVLMARLIGCGLSRGTTLLLARSFV